MATRSDVPSEPEPAVPRTPRQIARARHRLAFGRFWGRFRRNKMGLAGLVILIFFSAMATFALFADKSGLDKTLVTEQTLRPDCSFSTTPEQEAQGIREVPCPPSLSFPLGTDADGRSILTLVVQGSRISMLVGLVASTITMVIGSLVGIVAGYAGAWTDRSLMRITDFFLVIPFLALAIVLAAIFGSNIWVLISIIGFTSWPGTARLVRAQTLSVKEHLYVERARALGGSNWHVISRHILPNVMPVILANLILTVAIAILSESGLSFLGLGDITRVSWGTMIDQAFDNGALTIGAWWWLLIPSFCIVLLVLGFTMVGYAFDEVINPRIRER